MFSVGLMAMTLGLQPVVMQQDDAVYVCNPADEDQHRLCQIQNAGNFLGIPAELRFVTFDLMSGQRISVTYAFPISRKAGVEAAIREHMVGAEERLNPWGHSDGAHVWRNSSRQYLMEIHNGKLSVTVTQVR